MRKDNNVMDIKIDKDFLVRTTQKLVACDSPVGYYPKIESLLKTMVVAYGYEMNYDRKHTGYVRLEGKSHEKCVCLGAHVDTIGLVVRGFNEDGTLRVRQLGGINYASIEGECCRIYCRDGRVVNGQVICNKHSVHVWADAKQEPRDEAHMSISMIGDVTSPDEAKSLGVTQGAIVAVDPHFQTYDNGYIVSRYIDDKACVATLLGLLKWFVESGEKPAYDTLLAFPIYEEIGHGASYVPAEVSEYVALDISLLGPDYDSNEHQVGIIASDHHGPYDWNLTNELIQCVRKACGDGTWNTQVAFHFSTDAMAAYILGSNLYAGAFGPACLSTHGRERCHVDAIIETERLAIAYALGLGRELERNI